MFTQLLMEMYCLKQTDENMMLDIPAFCIGVKKPCYNCLTNNCTFLAYTTCENSLCYINEESLAEEIAGLGGEMLPEDSSPQNHPVLTDKWKEISVKKLKRHTENTWIFILNIVMKKCKIEFLLKQEYVSKYNM